MSWIKLDDGFFRHPKVIRAGRDARELYLAGLCFVAANLTDGRIPAEALRQLAADAHVRGPVRLAARLVEVGLWEAAVDGWVVHDYLDYNPSRADVTQQREAAAARIAAFRRRRQAPGNAPVTPLRGGGVTPEVTPPPSRTRTHDPSPTPAPTRTEHPTPETDDGGGTHNAPARALAVPKPAGPAGGQRGALAGALRDALGYQPDTASAEERRRFHEAVGVFLRASPPVTPDEVPRLVAAYAEHYTTPLTPRALANNLTHLRAAPARPPPRRSASRQTFSDQLAILQHTTRILEAKSEPR